MRESPRARAEIEHRDADGRVWIAERFRARHVNASRISSRGDAALQ